MPFRKALVWIHNQYLDKTKELFLYSTVGFIVLGAFSIVADFLLPWSQWAIILRTLILLPTASALFVLAYGLTLLYVDYKTAKDPEYRTWRLKLSPLMRGRIAALIGAVLFVLIFAVAQRPGYTLAASAIVAAVIGLFTFIRKTSKELTRSNIGLPDLRDAALDSHIKARAKAAAEKRRSRNKKEAAAEEKELDELEKLSLEKDLEK